MNVCLWNVCLFREEACLYIVLLPQGMAWC